MEIAPMILVIAASFAITTVYYVSLYRKLCLRRAEAPEILEIDFDEELVERLKPALARREHELRKALGELKKIRGEVEKILDEEWGNPEAEGGGDKRSSKGG